MIHVIRFAIHLIFLIYKPNNRIADVLVDFIKCFPPQKNGSYISFFKNAVGLDHLPSSYYTFEKESETKKLGIALTMAPDWCVQVTHLLGPPDVLPRHRPNENSPVHVWSLN